MAEDVRLSDAAFTSVRQLLAFGRDGHIRVSLIMCLSLLWTSLCVSTACVSVCVWQLRIQAVQARYTNPGQCLDSWIVSRVAVDREMLEARRPSVSRKGGKGKTLQDVQLPP